VRLWLAALLALAGCAHSELGPPPPVPIAGTSLTLEAESADDAAELARLAPLAFEALAPLQRWGGLRAPTRIVIVPDHATLEARVLHSAFGWLRAWARYDVVYVQSPRSWGLGARPSLDELRSILTHELAHCVMYQAISDGSNWSRREIPLWFREGFASWTAQQAGKRLSPEALSTALRAHLDLDPIGNAEGLYRDQEPLVYGAAHWAFARLEQQGDDRILALLTTMRSGWSYPVAFAQVYGVEPSAYEAEALAALRRPPAADPER
jgi:hypothetical protein